MPPKVAGSSPAPTNSLTSFRSVTYDWPLFDVTASEIGMGEPGTCLGVSVLLLGVWLVSR